MRLRTLAPLMLVLVGLLVAFPFTPRPVGAQAGGKVRVVTSAAPFVDMIRNVGGDLVEPVALVPPGADVDIYRPTARDLQLVSQAQIAIWNGLWLDEQIARDVARLQVPNLLTVTLTEGLPAIETAKGAEEYDQGDQEEYLYNPHMWLDASLGLKYVEQIRDVLIAADPGNAATYQANASRYLGELATFDAWALQQVATIPPANRKLVTFEDAFPYMARHYGLEVVGALVRGRGREPSAQEVAELITNLKAQRIPAIFVEPQFNAQVLEQAGHDAGVKIQRIYSDTLDDQVNTYLALMRFNVNSLVEGLR